VIRSLLASVWIAGLTLGSAYLGVEMQRRRAAPEDAPAVKATQSIALKSITVPVIANGTLQGYVLTSVVVAVTSDVLKTVPQPVEPLLIDAAFKAIYGEERMDFKHIEKQDLTTLSKKILESINTRAGTSLVTEVYFQELHYLNKVGDRPGSLFQR
jgi:hypothetical protein